jgi:hypothetical protein
VQLNVSPGSLANAFERRRRGGDNSQFVQEVRHGILLIKKAGLCVGDQLGDSSDRGRENNSPHRHRFHQDLRNSFTVAGEHHDIGLTVESS